MPADSSAVAGVAAVPVGAAGPFDGWAASAERGSNGLRSGSGVLGMRRQG
jgi:hypothetical protein